MKIYKLNMVFSSQEECDAWEKENLMVGERMMYNGEYVMSVMHDYFIGTEEVIITEIWTC